MVLPENGRKIGSQDKPPFPAHGGHSHHFYRLLRLHAGGGHGLVRLACSAADASPPLSPLRPAEGKGAERPFQEYPLWPGPADSRLQAGGEELGICRLCRASGVAHPVFRLENALGQSRERKESGGILPDVDIPVCRLYGADGFPGKGTVFEAGQAVAGRWRQSGADAALFPACVKRAHCVSGVFPGLPVDGGFSVALAAMGEPRCPASLAAISGVVGKNGLYCRSFPETPAPGMGEWHEKTGILSGTGKFAEIENLEIILFFCKISAPG